MKARPAVMGWLIIVLAWGSAASLVSVLSASEPDGIPRYTSVTAQLLGGTRAALAEYAFYGRADAVYHKGGAHYRTTAFTNTFFQRFQESIRYDSGGHLRGDELKEIMPWLRLAMSLDPEDEEYGLVAAYWIAEELGKPDTAMDVLLEMQEANPRSYLVQIGMGRFYAKAGDRERTKLAYTRALKLWPGDKDPDDRETKLDKREILSHLSVLMELEGDTRGAIRYLTEMIALFPDETTRPFRDRIEALREGREPRESALHRWNLQRGTQYYQLCGQGEEGHSGHEHDE